MKYKNLSPPLFIAECFLKTPPLEEEVAQAKRCDGGVQTVNECKGGGHPGTPHNGRETCLSTPRRRLKILTSPPVDYKSAEKE